MFNFYHVTI